jgi:hypothetical protein
MGQLCSYACGVVAESESLVDVDCLLVNFEGVVVDRIGGVFSVEVDGYVRSGAVISFLVVATVVVRVGFVAVVRVGGSDLVVLERGGGVGDDVVVMSVCLRVGG